MHRFFFISAKQIQRFQRGLCYFNNLSVSPLKNLTVSIKHIILTKFFVNKQKTVTETATESYFCAVALTDSMPFPTFSKWEICPVCF